MFVKGKVTEIVPDGDQVLVRSEDMMLNRMIEYPADLVVLAPSIISPEESLKLAAKRSRLKIKVKDLTELIDESL